MAGKQYYWKREPAELLRFIGQQGGDRKLRLFAAAWCRLWPDSASATDLIAAAELLADDETFHQEFTEVVKATEVSLLLPRIAALIEVCNGTDPFSCYMTASAVANGLLDGAQSPEAREALVTRARCVMGPPGRMKPGGWVTPTAIAMAQDIYDNYAFTALGILADLLEDSRCREKLVLDHCRQSGEHIRGCWVVDLILGKQMCKPNRGRHPA